MADKTVSLHACRDMSHCSTFLQLKVKLCVRSSCFHFQSCDMQLYTHLLTPSTKANITPFKRA